MTTTPLSLELSDALHELRMTQLALARERERSSTLERRVESMEAVSRVAWRAASAVPRRDDGQG